MPLKPKTKGALTDTYVTRALGQFPFVAVRENKVLENGRVNILFALELPSNIPTTERGQAYAKQEAFLAAKVLLPLLQKAREQRIFVDTSKVYFAIADDAGSKLSFAFRISHRLDDDETLSEILKDVAHDVPRADAVGTVSTNRNPHGSRTVMQLPTGIWRGTIPGQSTRVPAGRGSRG